MSIDEDASQGDHAFEEKNNEIDIAAQKLVLSVLLECSQFQITEQKQVQWKIFVSGLHCGWNRIEYRQK